MASPRDFSTSLTARLLAALPMAWLLGGPSGASAQAIASLDMFRSVALLQTADASATLNGAFFTLAATPANPGDFDSGLLDTPATPRLAMASDSGGAVYRYQTALLADQAAMDATYGPGPYTATLSHSVGGAQASASLSYASDLYPTSLPYLAGDSFSRLQGMDAASAITLDISPYTNTAGAPDEAGIFLTIFSADGAVFSASFLPASTTSITVPGAVLQAGTHYIFDLDYSNRIYTATSGTVNPVGQIGFDVRTSGEFTTAVPEPSGMALALAGLGLMAIVARRRLR